MIFSSVIRFAPPAPAAGNGTAVAAFAFLTALLTPCHGHKVSSASVILELNTKTERSFLVSVATQVESSGEAGLDDQISPEQAARNFVESCLEVLIDEKPQPLALTTQIINTSDANTPANLRRLEVLAEWKGKLPPAGKEVALFLKEAAEMNLVLLVKKDGEVARRLQVMFPGEYSRAESIEPLMEENPFEAESAGTALPPAPAPHEAPQAEVSLFPSGAAQKTQSSGSIKKFRAGAAAAFQPMFLPVGLLAALLVAAATPRSLVFGLLLFVVAQSVGLSLAALGAMPTFSWSAWTANISLFVLAADNLISKQARPWRSLPAIAGGFAAGNLAAGLPSFAEIGTPPMEVGSLVLFQAGFEAVLLLVCLISGAVLGLSSKHTIVRRLFLIPLSIGLAGSAASFFLDHGLGWAK